MEYNHLEGFLSTIRSGKVALGCCITFADPAVTEIAAESGFDFCWIDAEHGELDRYTAMLHIMALKGTNCAPLIRVPDASHTAIKKVIDFAPAGIIVPMVMNAEDVVKVVEACRYPPLGNRGCGFRRSTRYGTIPTGEYMERSKHEPLVICQIEHISAVRDIDAILKVPGLDGVLIGPYDLSASMDLSGKFDDPVFNAAVDEVCSKTRAAGKLLGAYTEQSFDRWKKRGVQFMGIINDTSAMRKGFEEMIARTK